MATLKKSLYKMMSDAGLLSGHEWASGAHRENIALPERVELLLKILKQPLMTSKGEIICMVMYDIEDNRVRTMLAKFLIRSGFIRIQKSVYVARLTRKKLRVLAGDLAEVNECYENKDSIIVMPLMNDSLHESRLIGKKVDLQMIISQPNVVFI